MKILVIGASAAGLKAACRVRRLLPKAEVTVLEEGQYISYAACGFPYFLSADIDDFRQLLTTAYDVEKTPEYFKSVKDVTVLTGIRVDVINPERKTVKATELRNDKKADYSYDILVLATGAHPVKPVISGIDLPGVFTFTRPEDVIELRQAANRGELEKVAIIGAGFVGCELCESFRALWGLETVLFEIEPSVLPGMLDPEISAIIETELKRQDVELFLNTDVTGIESSVDKLRIDTDSGLSIEGFDRVIIAAGVTPRVELAKNAGIEIGTAGGIVVDLMMRTGAPDVFAVGDCVEVVDAVTKQQRHLPLGSLANRMGRVAANTIAEREDRFGPVCGTLCLKVFDINVAATGITAETASEAGLKVGESWGVFTDRSHYYPEHDLVSAKMVFDLKSLQLLGVQAAGKGETVKLVNSASQMIKSAMTLKEIREFEHAYAPPYDNALNPLHFLSYAGIASVEEGITAVSPRTIEDSAGDFTLIDVREEYEIKESPLQFPYTSLLSIPLTSLRKRIEEVPRGEPLAIICQRGTRSSEAVRILHENGFDDVRYMGGGVGFLQS
ncbi:hypothetical protein CEE37_07445 [candidate division LCP-89 bacterium B3_LCP]|uniref:Rhodanese domain-containing protein n=1 Tax=candidate division LCP-89 bacterium B3_LCP TaxID=2012998 RepID=A0A532V0Q1_UNCL8|nr:MAG: hypothetical protein CEE37_07445 [candidate division LCP-89 bacterium B3_LCP]